MGLKTRTRYVVLLEVSLVWFELFESPGATLKRKIGGLRVFPPMTVQLLRTLKLSIAHWTTGQGLG